MSEAMLLTIGLALFTTIVGTAIGILAGASLQSIASTLAGDGEEPESALEENRTRKVNRRQAEESSYPVVPPDSWKQHTSANLTHLFSTYPLIIGEPLNVLEPLLLSPDEKNARLPADFQPVKAYYKALVRGAFLENEKVRLVPGYQLVSVVGIDRLGKPLFDQYYLRALDPIHGEVYAGDHWGLGQDVEKIGLYRFDPDKKIYLFQALAF